MPNMDRRPINSIADKKLNALLSEVSTPILESHECFIDLVTRYLVEAKDKSHLDSWFPLGNEHVQHIFIIAIYGLTIQLSEKFDISHESSKVALICALENSKFYPENVFSNLFQWTLNLPRYTDKDVNSVDTLFEFLFYEAGKSEANQWIKKGIATSPEIKLINVIIELVEKEAKFEIAQPDHLHSQAILHTRNTENLSKNAKFFLGYRNLFRFTCLRHYPLTSDQIQEFSSSFDTDDWQRLSSNKNLIWDFDLLMEHYPNWHYENVAANTAIPWGSSLMNAFVSEIFCSDFLKNNNINWIELMNEYKYFIRLEEGALRIGAKSTSFPWDAELIEFYKDCMSTSDNTWSNLSYNPSLPWSEKLLLRFEDYWDWSMLSHNPGVPWVKNRLLEKFESKLNWEGLSINEGINWFEPTNSKHWDKLILSGLSQNRGLSWSNKVLDTYHDAWDWQHLSGNPSLPWSVSLYERYSLNWDWNALTGNEGLPWSFDLLKKLEPVLSWDRPEFDLSSFKYRYRSVSENKAIKWQPEMIRFFSEKLNIEDISEHSDCGVLSLSDKEVQILLHEMF